MEQLNRQVRRAQWWLGVQRFVGSLGWCCSAALLGALVLIAVDKFRPTGVEAWMWGAGALGLGLLAAAAWAIFSGRGPIDAAIEVDRRFGLKERVSSTLAMSDDQRRSEVGQALVEDAVRRVERIDVHEQFKVSPGRQILLPLVPGFLAVLVAFLPAAVDKPAEANPAVKKQLEKSTRSLRQKLVEQRKLAQEQGLVDAQNLFQRLEEQAEELATRNLGDRKQALVKLNDLSRELQRRRKELGGAENIQRQLNQLKHIARGPADEFLKALSRGNFEKALEQLKQLQADLAGGQLDDQQRQELAKQLAEMQKKLEDLVNAHREAEKALQQRINQARQAGRQEEANRLQEQLDNLRQQRPQMNQFQGLADKLGRCAKCLQNGQLQGADGMFNQLRADLEDLQRQLQELEMLDGAMQQMRECRNQMCCPMCGGVGCRICNGFGLGAGQGAGPRPESETPVNFRDTSTRQQVGPGAASVVGEVDGPNIPGDVRQQIQEQYESARHETAEPLVDQWMPRPHRRHAREYFDRFRTGQ